MAQIDMRVEFSGEWNALVLGWGGRGRGLDQRIERAIGKATRLNAMMAAKRVKRTINLREYTGKDSKRNSGLQRALKHGNDLPLVQTGYLRSAIEGRRIDHYTGFVGLFKDGLHGAKGVEWAHKFLTGYSFPVTDKMRRLFSMLSAHRRAITSDPVTRMASSRGGRQTSALTGRALQLWNQAPGFKWKGLKPSTTAIRVPGRDFLTPALHDTALKKKMAAKYMKALFDAVSLKQRGH